MKKECGSDGSSGTWTEWKKRESWDESERDKSVGGLEYFFARKRE